MGGGVVIIIRIIGITIAPIPTKRNTLSKGRIRHGGGRGTRGSCTGTSTTDIVIVVFNVLFTFIHIVVTYILIHTLVGIIQIPRFVFSVR